MVLVAELEPIDYFESYDLTNIVTPVNAKLLEAELLCAEFDREETNFLVQGFTHGFDIGYVGPKVRQCNASNIPIKIGSETVMWNKIMKEVKAGRVAGPYDTVPFKNYIQSPIGLVPKAGGRRIIRQG